MINLTIINEYDIIPPIKKRGMKMKINKKSQIPYKVTLNVIVGYDDNHKPIKQKLIDVYAEATEVRNSSNNNLLVTEFRELITGRIIARSIPDHLYLDYPDFQRYGTYTGKLDKTYKYLKVGDIDIEIDPGHGLSFLLEHDLEHLKSLDWNLAEDLGPYYKKMLKDIIEYKNKYDKDTLNSYLDQLDYTAMQIAFSNSKIDPSKPLTYYNKEEYVFIDGDDLLILKYHNIPENPITREKYYFGTFFDSYFYEIVTKRKFAMECGIHNYMDKKYTFHFDRDINTDVLARRLLSEEEINAYKKENPKVISKRIDNILTRQYSRDRERIENSKKAI